MSSVNIWAPDTMPQALASTDPAMSPAAGPRQRHQSAAERMTSANPVVAGHSRAVHSSGSKRRNAMAVAQYCSGGFSKYLRPFRRGVT